MSGDYSRIDFDPKRDYTGVLLQQGRPLTDRDWNDLVAQHNRRIQAGTLDASSPLFVATTTADAFNIVSDGAGGFTIGRGRLYVDGLLAENHGTGALQWDAELAERYGKDAIPYTKQPYLPNAPALPTSGGPNLVYLDVWQREVTRFEDGDIVEPALGVDTTTRLQTVWQVKLLTNVGAGVVCATPLDQIGAWKTQTAPSAGRLTTKTGDVPGDVNPCIIPPAGGYKGLENQLYRVEIHKKGPLGTATFKWSRDNASVETQVTQIPDLSHLVVESVGKDDVLRFSDGDWIEITDDWREFSGLPGELHMIKVGKGVDDATRIITLDQPLSTASPFPVDAQGNVDPKRHTRIRRWDQKGKILDKNGNAYTDLGAAGSTGEVAVPTGGLQLLLENGILVAFDVDPAGGEFHVGDYWTFAARIGDASIELLDKEPPRGIHHHYAKLAVFTPPSTIEDCRPKPPAPEACCCVSVRPGEDIQKAIDGLPDAGGCVCLKTGVHFIGKAIAITRGNVKLVGESPGTIVRVEAAGAALLIGRTGGGGQLEGIDISTIVFERIGPAGNFPGVVTVVNTHFSSIEDCGVKDTFQAGGIGISLSDCQQFRVARCTIRSAATGLFATGNNSADLWFQDNLVELSPQTTAGSAFSIGLSLQDVIAPCRIEANTFHGVAVGIDVRDSLSSVQSLATGTVVTRNFVAVAALAPTSAPVAAITVAGNGSQVSQNLVELPRNSSQCGILVTGVDVDVTDNHLHAISTASGADCSGLRIGYRVNNQPISTISVTAKGNTVSGWPFGILATDTIGVIITDNVIDVSGDVAIAKSACISLAQVWAGQVNDNALLHGGTAISSLGGAMNRITGNTIADGGYGILLNAEFAALVAQNRIYNMINWAIGCGGATGRTQIAENRISSCAFGAGVSASVLAYVVYGELCIEANEIVDTGISADGKTIFAAAAYGIGGALVLEARIESNLITYSGNASRPAGNEDRALFMIGFMEIQSQWAAGTQVIGFPIQILGNKFVGPGASALVELQQLTIPGNTSLRIRFERVFFNNNYCMHWAGNLKGNAATVVLVGRAATVANNQIKTLFGPTRSVNFGDMPGPYIGNVAGPTHRPVEFPAPENSFNVVI